MMLKKLLYDRELAPLLAYGRQGLRGGTVGNATHAVPSELSGFPVFRFSGFPGVS